MESVYPGSIRRPFSNRDLQSYISFPLYWIDESVILEHGRKSYSTSLFLLKMIVSRENHPVDTCNTVNHVMSQENVRRLDSECYLFFSLFFLQFSKMAYIDSYQRNSFREKTIIIVIMQKCSLFLLYCRLFKNSQQILTFLFKNE